MKLQVTQFLVKYSPVILIMITAVMLCFSAYHAIINWNKETVGCFVLMFIMFIVSGLFAFFKEL